MNAINAITDEDREQIEQAIAEAEARSSAEIVCAVATESGRYDRAESIVGLIGALLALCGAHGGHAWLTYDAGDWAVTTLHLAWQCVAVVVGFLAGNLLANRVHPIRRLFTSDHEMETEVRRATSHAFALANMARTEARSGLLIYISLFERRITIRPAKRVHEALGDEVINHLRDVAVDDLRSGSITNAFIDVVREAAGHLAEAMPEAAR